MLSAFARYRIIVFSASLGIVALLLISFNIKEKNEPGLFEKIILEISSPFQKAIQFSVKKMASLWNNYIFLVDLKRQNATLMKTNNELKGENIRLKEAVIANIRLRKLLHFKEKFKAPMIPAEVIGEDPSSWFKTILIDKGGKDSIKRNMPVVTSGGIVGRVMKVSRTASKVLLATDHRSAIDAMVQRSRARGILEGRVDRQCSLKYVFRTDDVKVEDYIISSGLGGVFPKGLLLGKVSRIRKDSFGMFQYVKVTPFVDFAKLEEVFIVMVNATAPDG